LSKSGSICLATVLTLLTGTPCYAGERIVLTCTGTMTDLGDRSPDAEGITIDLDAGLLMWRSDTFPLVNEGNIIRFKKAELPKPGEEVPPWTEGWLDRVTGTFYATYDWGSASEPKQSTYELTCKPAKPLF
jgi:hypothetical protein